MTLDEYLEKFPDICKNIELKEDLALIVLEHLKSERFSVNGPEPWVFGACRHCGHIDWRIKGRSSLAEYTGCVMCHVPEMDNDEGKFCQIDGLLDYVITYFRMTR